MAEVSLQSLWDAIQQMKGQISMEVNAHLDLKNGAFQAGLMDIQATPNSVTGQITELQKRVSANEDEAVKLSKRVAELEKDNAYLREKIEDQENMSRRNNLRFVNVPETIEGRDMITFVEQQLIPTLFGRENFPTAPVVERAHRTPTHLNSPRSHHPRPILIKLLNFQDKMKIMRLAREKESLSWKGTTISVYPDFSPGLVKKRREFDNVKKKLRAANLKYSLQYPSTLRVIVEGKPKLFRCPKEAEVFLQGLPSLPGQET